MWTCCNKSDIRKFESHSFLLHSLRSFLPGPLLFSASIIPLSYSKNHFNPSIITKPITDHSKPGGCSHNTIYSLVTWHRNCHCFYLQHLLESRDHIIFTTVSQSLAQCLIHMNLNKYLVNG